MISSDRLDELQTYAVDDDCPDDAKIRIPAGDLRDLVRLVGVVRASVEMRDAVVTAAIGDDHVVAVMLAVQRFDAERAGT